MEHTYRQVAIEHRGDIVCVRIPRRKLDETAVEQLGHDLTHLLVRENCRKLVLNLGPDPLECRYSMFLAILVAARRQLLERGGALKLCAVGPEIRGVFEACHLTDHFDFLPDEPSAVAALSR